ncbi:hypothetical protein [Agromyces agglutinans]|uniref:hypothetical protein n=1 Tax=Agromyces agglutinans TaxID=2662258 RepID=UPI001299B4B1|nr:hypothetical protein [Agromyces agglutinans]
MSQWGPRGISGTIGIGPQAGKYVIAELVTFEGERRLRRSVHQPLYVLWFPAESLTEPDGTAFLMDSPAVDGARENDSGGLIDLLTSRLGVRWDTADAEFERALNWYREHIWGEV